jgi:Spy/CpxP family protein refolding chaperone
VEKKYKILLFIFLAISVGFNIFFVGSYTHTRKVMKKWLTPAGRMQIITEQLDLTKDQQKKFIQMRRELRIKGNEIKHVHIVDINTFWREVVKDNPDFQKIETLLERSFQGLKDYKVLSIECMLKFLKTLTPEQREIYVDIIRRKKLL